MSIKTVIYSKLDSQIHLYKFSDLKMSDVGHFEICRCGLHMPGTFLFQSTPLQRRCYPDDVITNAYLVGRVPRVVTSGYCTMYAPAISGYRTYN